MRSVLLAFMLVLAFTFPAAAQQETCEGAPPPRLIYGVQARVVESGVANRLRTDPTTSAMMLDQIAPGEVFFVGSGPVCADGYTWWYVNYNGTVGWTAEGTGTEYFLEPVLNTISTTGETTTSVAFEGVSFSFDNAFTSDTLNVNGVVVPSEDPVEEGPFWLGHPAYVEFQFDSYNTINDHTNAYIRIYPAADFSDINEGAAQEIEALQALLESGEFVPPDEPLPFLPIFNAGQIFHTQVKPLEFANGSGLRYVAAFAQDVYPVSNERILYTFQGLTDDGEYYVSAIFPISSETLPDEIEPNFDFDAFMESYDTYMSDLTNNLNSAAPDTFAPDLSLIDALIESLDVEPSIS